MTEANSTQPPIPSRITVSTFTAARIKEIQAMRRCINESSGTKMVFQKLPNHMRRRAMSHVVKRLPRRLREIHINQMKKSGLPPKSKRPTRKYRRRPFNLQSDYARRKRRIKWLDTHIWHAKRFHMIEKWGYKLPKQPCDKAFRACYRATTQHCLVQDISYNRCIEISGEYKDIMQHLIKITDNKLGLTFGAKCFCEGKKFGTVAVFDPSCLETERKPIGEVDFFWNHEMDGDNRILWLFVHPAYYKQLLDLFISLYQLQPRRTEDNEKISTYFGSQGIVLKELEYELGKFRLTGPLSTAVLKQALRLVDLEDKPDLPHWFDNYPIKILFKQNRVFKDLMDVTYVPPNAVISVIVYDPRLNLPKKRTKALLTACQDYDSFDKFQDSLSLSPLFKDSVRDFVKDNKNNSRYGGSVEDPASLKKYALSVESLMPDQSVIVLSMPLPSRDGEIEIVVPMCPVSNADICKLRSNFLIPGSDVPLENAAVIPVILLWRPGNRGEVNNGYASGWDVIVPSSWSQSFFLSFVMWGARAGGLRETESIAFERSQADILYPDTAAGEQEENSIKEACRETFFRLPPNKRTNFNKFGIVSPFSFNWKMLIAEWSGINCDYFSVLRDRNLLKNVQEYLKSNSSQSYIPSLPENCLVPIKVTPIGRGRCSRFSIICIAEQGDIKSAPIEPQHKDLWAQKRNSLRQEHKNLLQKLRRRRKRANRLGKPVIPTDCSILRKFKHEMRSLWLPEPKAIRSSSSRTVIGFIKHGDFSFTLGQSKGLGYIVANSLTALAAYPHRNKVLIRNPNSRQYKLAVLTVVVE